MLRLLCTSRRVFFGGLAAAALTAASLAIVHAAPPGWSPVAAMGTPRYLATATVLADGRVLVAGGYGGSELASAEIFDPATNTWTPAGSMATARYIHGAAALGDGRVLVAGGPYTGGVELYDPATNTWVTAASLPIAASYAPVVVGLADGRVLVADVFGSTLGNAYLYDAASNSWSQSAPWSGTNEPRHFGAGVLLKDGRVLVAGGNGRWGYSTPSAEIYDPVARTWTAVASMNFARERFAAVTLDDGRVLVVGGFDYASGSWTNRTDAEVYDPVANTWTLTPGTGGPGGQFPAAALRRDGQVLAVGGYTGGYSSAAALYDPLHNVWSLAPSSAVGRYATVVVPIAGARTLVAGGHTGSSATSHAEVFGQPNSVPVADAGADQTVSGCPTCLGAATLDASGSSDADGDTLTYTWKEGATVLATTHDPTKAATVYLPLGTHTITLVVTDGAGGSASDDVVVTVVDGSTGLLDQISALTADLARCDADLDAARAQNAVLAARNATLETQNAALEAQNAALQALNADLQAQNAQLAADLAAAQAALAAATAERQALEAALAAALGVVQEDLRQTFRNSSFAIPGATDLDRLDNLVTALTRLNRGRKEGIYANLSGR